MGYRCHRRRYRNSNTLGAVSNNNNNCNGTLGKMYDVIVMELLEKMCNVIVGEITLQLVR